MSVGPTVRMISLFFREQISMKCGIYFVLKRGVNNSGLEDVIVIISFFFTLL